MERISERKTSSYEQVTPPYPEFRGMDIAGPKGFCFLENMYIDYEGGGGAVESMVGYRKCRSLNGKLHSLCLIGKGDEGILLIHSGEGLYLARVSERVEGLPLKRIFTLEDTHSLSLPLSECAFISDGKRLISVAKNGEVGIISEEGEIAGCSCGEVYDGRLFLSGNPHLKGKVFYSSPISEGVPYTFESFADEGMAIDSVISLDGYLITVGRGNNGGTVACHRRAQNGGYPTVRLTDRLDILSCAAVFNRQIVFISNEGLMALDPPTEGSEIKITCRSGPINGILLREDPLKVKFTVWMGYLVISTGTSLYLADPRGEDGYDWYPIVGVGGHRNDRRVYRYKRNADEGLLRHPNTDGVASGLIYSKGKEGGDTVYYSVEGNDRYSVYPTAELSGGYLTPPVRIISDGRLMWFATDEALYLFNNDKRGLAPLDIPFADGEEAEVGTDEIHPLYYSFAGHSPTYTALTHRLKPTDGKKGLIKLKAMGGGDVNLRAISGGKQILERKIAASKAGNATRSPLRQGDFLTASLPERFDAREYQLYLTSGEFASPMGIISISRGEKTHQKMKKGKP